MRCSQLPVFTVKSTEFLQWAYDKTNKIDVRQVKTKISLGIWQVWQSLWCALDV